MIESLVGWLVWFGLTGSFDNPSSSHQTNKSLQKQTHSNNKHPQTNTNLFSCASLACPSKNATNCSCFDASRACQFETTAVNAFAAKRIRMDYNTPITSNVSVSISQLYKDQLINISRPTSTSTSTTSNHQRDKQLNANTAPNINTQRVPCALGTAAASGAASL